MPSNGLTVGMVVMVAMGVTAGFEASVKVPAGGASGRWSRLVATVVVDTVGMGCIGGCVVFGDAGGRLAGGY